MCFSATASFVAGSALSAVGVTTIRMTSRTAQIPFAMIPLLFGAHQLTEGMIWLSFGTDTLLPNAALTFVYSLFSHVLWPIFIPFAVGLLETDPLRKKAVVACQFAGAVVGLYLLYVIIQFPVTSRVLGNHIAYESPHFYRLPLMLLYLTATCASCLFSSHKIIQVFGALTLVTFIAAYAIHAATFFSVWCFFAALLSFIGFYYFKQARLGALI
jgi:uncharacterized protein DUF6629